MRIALVGTIASSIIGFRREFIMSALEQGHEVYAFATDYNQASKKLVEELGAVPIAYSLSRTGMNPLRDLIDTIRLVRIFKYIKPDLVFSYFVKPVIFGTIAAKIAGVKRRVGMLEGLGYIFTDQPEGQSAKIFFLRRVQVFLYKFSFRFLDNIIFLNQDDPKDLIEKYRINIRNISILGGIGLDLTQYPYVKPSLDNVSFLFIGRLLKEKGINEFLDAAKIVKKSHPEINFTVLGGLDEENPGALKLTVLKHLTDIGLINYPGHVSDMHFRIAQHSVFVLPSYREGLPRSTQEAMATGRPIITTDVPGCRDTVVDGLNGFLVPPWNPHLLATKMLFFIENPDQIEKMGLESYHMAQQKFDAFKVNKRLIELINLC